MRDIYKNFFRLTEGFEKQLLFLSIIALTQSVLEFLLIIILVSVLKIFTSLMVSSELALDSDGLKALSELFPIYSNEDLIVLFMIVVALSAAFRIFFISLYNRLVANLSVALAEKTMASMLESEYTALINFPKNTLIASVTKKIDVIVGLFIIPLVLNLNNIVILIGIMASLMFIDFFTTLEIFCFLGFVYFLFVRFFHRRIFTSGQKISGGAEDIVSFVDEIIGGVREALLYNASSKLLQEFASLLSKFYHAQANLQIWAATPRPLIEGIVLLAISVVSLFIASSYVPNSQDLLPLLGAIIFGLQRMLPLVQQLYSNITVIKGSQSTVLDFLELRGRFERQKTRLKALQKESIQWDSRAVKLDCISFSYPQHAPVFEDISITIPREARFIGFKGESGSGKSTLADLLMGLLIPSKGVIEIGNVGLSEENRRSWMERVVHVPQTPHILSGTIAENVAFQADKVNFERVTECLAIADLTDFVESLEQGVNTAIGLGGRALSGGQKQRIAIARALYRDFYLMVLDEAFNGIDDPRVHKIIAAAKNKLESHQKLILISHVQEHFKSVDLLISINSAGVREVPRSVDVLDT